jgi:hypothetical protein
MSAAFGMCRNAAVAVHHAPTGSPAAPRYHRRCRELLDLARANAQALIIATTGYLAQAGIPSDGWAGYLRQVFATAWDDSMAAMDVVQGSDCRRWHAVTRLCPN